VLKISSNFILICIKYHKKNFIRLLYFASYSELINIIKKINRTADFIIRSIGAGKKNEIKIHLFIHFDNLIEDLLEQKFIFKLYVIIRDLISKFSQSMIFFIISEKFSSNLGLYHPKIKILKYK